MNQTFEQLTEELRGQIDLVFNGRRYAFDYADDPIKARENIKRNQSCIHLISSGIVLNIFDGEELVGCVSVCSKCGMVLLPSRVCKGGATKPLSLGKQRGTFKRLTRLLSKPAQPC